MTVEKAPVELASPQPYATLPHTADTGVEVHGATAAEALARLVLAYAQAVTGDAAVTPATTRELSVPGGAELAIVAVDVLRAVHALATVEHLVPAAAAVLAVSADEGARVRLRLAALDRERLTEGLDVKAVTYHAARLAQDPDGAWSAAAIFDI